MSKLYTREILATISFQSTNNREVVRLKQRLREELSFWLSPEVWSQVLPWRSERHSFVRPAGARCPVSLCGPRPGKGQSFKIIYRLDSTPQINVLVAYAVEQTITTLATRIQNSRVDVWSDSKLVVQSWSLQGGSNTEINHVFKRVIQCA